MSPVPVMHLSKPLYLYLEALAAHPNIDNGGYQDMLARHDTKSADLDPYISNARMQRCCKMTASTGRGRTPGRMLISCLAEGL